MNPIGTHGHRHREELGGDYRVSGPEPVSLVWVNWTAVNGRRRKEVEVWRVFE